ncbi:hypothetical protein TKK_0012359 [Trichogramma kaykai]|uniref:Uncharacterized protein n=1 Tax=Trichogramma kaykai TaxID=54128 RepID=A0ABD2WPR6_9HYME
MFVLVFWKKTRDVSVVKIDQLQTNVDEGKKTAVRYSDGQMYKALVVKKSYDEKYLRKIDVESDGKILSQKSRLQSSKASQKKNSGATSSVVQKKKLVESSNQKVSTLPNIFNDFMSYGTDSENSDEDNFKVSSVKRKRAQLIESSDEDLEFMKKKKYDGAVSNDVIIENNFSSEEDNDDYLTGHEEEDRERIELQSNDFIIHILWEEMEKHLKKKFSIIARKEAIDNSSFLKINTFEEENYLTYKDFLIDGMKKET